MNTKPTNQAADQSGWLTSDTLNLLLNVAHVALEHRKAEQDIAAARRTYYAAIRAFEDGEGRIGPGHPQFDEMKLATVDEYSAYLRAKHTARNVKRRLETACRKATS